MELGCKDSFKLVGYVEDLIILLLNIKIECEREDMPRLIFFTNHDRYYRTLPVSFKDIPVN